MRIKNVSYFNITRPNNKNNGIINTQTITNGKYIRICVELYDIFTPIIKEKYIIVKIIDMKCDMETCKLKQKLKKLKQKLKELNKQNKIRLVNFIETMNEL